MTVATTRPETMLGDTAVAVNPRDERFKAFIGQTLILPLVEREIPVIADDFVDPEFGTGAVKVTPAHDPDDFEMGRRHNLAQINVMTEDGRMNENAGDYDGMDRFECRESAAGGPAREEAPRSDAAVHALRRPLLPLPHRRRAVPLRPVVRADEAAGRAALAAAGAEQGRASTRSAGRTSTSPGSRTSATGASRARSGGATASRPGTATSAADHRHRAPTPTQCAECGAKDIRQRRGRARHLVHSALWPFSTLGWPDDDAGC